MTFGTGRTLVPARYKASALSNLMSAICFISDEVLSEEVILKWYKESHSAKGKSIFLDQMKKFVDWLQNAEEESDEESEEEED